MHSDSDLLVDKLSTLAHGEDEFLRQAITSLVSTLDIDEVLEKLLLYIKQIVPFESACVFLQTDDKNYLRSVACSGFANADNVIGFNYPIDDPLIKTIQSGATPLILNDAKKDPRFKGWGGTEDIRGWMGIPLISRGQVFGLLTLDSLELAAFSSDDANLVQAFANQAAILIENSRLYEAAYQRAEEADTLRKAVAAVTETLQQDEAIERILVQLGRVVPYDSASVQLKKGGYLEIVGGRGWGRSSSVVGFRFPLPGDNPNTLVIQERKPIILGDAQSYHPSFRIHPHNHISSWMGVPLIVQDRVIGMLALDSKQKDFYTSHHADLVTAFADQVAIVLENARLFSIQRQRADELATLFSTSAAMSAHIELNQVLAEITRQTTLALNGTSCYVSLLNEDNISAKVVAEYYTSDANPAERRSSIGISCPLTSHDLNQFSKNQAIVTHISDPDGDLITIEELTAFNSKTCLSLPLIARSRVIGELALWDSRTERDFNESEIRLGQTIANQAAIALEQARLYEVERQRVEQLDALRATAADITAELELSKLLEIILQRAITLISATGGDLGLYDKGKSQLLIVTSINMGIDYTGTIMALGEGVMGSVAETLQPLIIQDYSSWEGRSPQYQNGPWHAAMSSPLIVHGRLVGTIGIVDSDPERQFTLHDLNLLTLFAQQAAIAIHNAQLHSEVQKMAITDPLTGLYNRRGLFELGEKEIERSLQSRCPIAAIMLDIDHFKQVNDSFSHAVGDQVLKELANRCKDHLRKNDLLGRYGGEEFAILLSDTDEECAIEIAERLRKSVEEKAIETDRGIISITISLGVSVAFENSPELAILLDHADTAMYAAKLAGRNRVSVNQINP
jgi:diguanylate cyclase (GGDEF)-like protein